MDFKPKVRAAAEKLGLITKAGDLAPLDSLTIVDLLIELEAVTSVEIPSSMVRIEEMRTIEQIDELLNRVDE